MDSIRNNFQYSQKEDYGKVPEYLIEKRRQEEEAQREYDAYIQVIYRLYHTVSDTDFELENVQQTIRNE